MFHFKNNTHGSHREFLRLFDEQLAGLFALAIRMTRNHLDAEDLVQDTAMKAFRYFNRFDRGTNFRAWTYRILTNNYINNYRKKKKSPDSVEIDNVAFKLKDSDNGYWDRLDDRNNDFSYSEIFDDELNRAIESLPDEYRIVVLLSDVESFNYKEIAEIIGRPIGTVMSRLHRGRKILQRALTGYARKQGYVSV